MCIFIRGGCHSPKCFSLGALRRKKTKQREIIIKRELLLILLYILLCWPLRGMHFIVCQSAWHGMAHTT